MKLESDYRVELDSMGEMRVPALAYYGAQTARAVENFPVSGQRMPRGFVSALGVIKAVAAEVNGEMGFLPPDLAALIVQAADEVARGELDGHFPVDVYQTGSGTSSNMNANEVIAGRANELAGKGRGGRAPVHPNDHVNLQQSSNDVVPTAIHLAVKLALRDHLVPQLSSLEIALTAKAQEFDSVVKLGRTHLQDATPVRVGQVFSGYAQQVRYAVERALRVMQVLGEVPLGGTAVGTGINSHPDFAARVIAGVSARARVSLRPATDSFEAQSAKDALVEASGLLRTVGVSLHKIANDIRWLASGPRGGIGELVLTPTQPGSSIMPGKVNPVMCEMLMQAVARLVGADATVVWAASHGSNFELNVMMPVMAAELLTAIDILGNAVGIFTRRLVTELAVDPKRCAGGVEQSLAMCTALAPLIGYDAAADIAKEAFRTGQTVREVAAARKILPADKLAAALDPVRMTSPHPELIGSGGA